MKDVGKSDDTFDFGIVSVIEHTFNYNKLVLWNNINFLDNLEHGILLVNE